jgi:hypothetical protein
LRGSKYVGLHLDGVLINDEVPVLHSLLVEESFDHLLNPANFLSGVNSSLCEGISHTSSFTYRVWDTVKQTKLSGQEELLLSNFDEEHGLLNLSYPLVVSAQEVLSN